jgi:hypothetical protein
MAAIGPPVINIGMVYQTLQKSSYFLVLAGPARRNNPTGEIIRPPFVILTKNGHPWWFIIWFNLGVEIMQTKLSMLDLVEKIVSSEKNNVHRIHQLI